MTEEYQQKDWREACCIEVLLYQGRTSGFQSGDVPLGEVTLVTPVGRKQVEDPTDPDRAMKLAKEWANLLGFNVRKVVREKIVKTTYNDVVMEEGTPCPLCGGTGTLGPARPCLCQY